jgi:glycosyltransferase involved in cell wall biosynthesis
MRPDLSIIIPCFNEAKNISIVLNQLEQIINQTKYNIEVVVIDGGSTDSTPTELKEKFETLPRDNFKLILNETRGGYGADINKALAFASGDVLSWTHADMQTDIKDIITAFQLFKKNDSDKIIVKGRRKNRKISETFFSFGMQIAVFLLLRLNLSDINAQPKLFSKDFYNNFLKNKSPSDFSLDLFMLYQAKTNNYKIAEIPVYFKERLHGEAKGGGSFKTKIKLIFRTFAYIVKLKLIIKN